MSIRSPLTVELVVLELADVFIAAREGICPLAVELPVKQFASVFCAVRAHEGALSGRLVVLELADVFAAIGIPAGALSIALVVMPLTHILRVAVVFVDTLAISPHSGSILGTWVTRQRRSRDAVVTILHHSFDRSLLADLLECAQGAPSALATGTGHLIVKGLAGDFLGGKGRAGASCSDAVVTCLVFAPCEFEAPTTRSTVAWGTPVSFDIVRLLLPSAFFAAISASRSASIFFRALSVRTHAQRIEHSSSGSMIGLFRCVQRRSRARIDLT